MAARRTHSNDHAEPKSIAERLKRTPGGLSAEDAALVYSEDVVREGVPVYARAALPGTPQKVSVMCERAACGKSPFHPDDFTVADCEAMGLLCTIEPANGSASWKAKKNREARSTAGNIPADERQVREHLEAVRRETLESEIQAALKRIAQSGQGEK